VGGNAAGWMPGAGSWGVALDGTHVLASAGGFISAGSSAWTNYKVSALVKNLSTAGYAKVLARYRDSGDFYACGIDAGGSLSLAKMSGGTWSALKTTSYAVNPTLFYQVTVTVNNGSLACTAVEQGSSRTASVSASDGQFASGAIGAAASANAEFDNFVVVSV
jgi:hypothetical protein